MGIRFRCHHCEHELNLKEFQAGRRARCPSCSGRFRVPTTSADFSVPLDDQEAELATTNTASNTASNMAAGASAGVVLNPASNRSNAFDLRPSSSDPDLAEMRSAATGSTTERNSTTLPMAIQQAPQAIWYVRPPSGGQYGPAEGQLFHSWLQDNRVSADSYVWRDGWPQWQLAGDVFIEYFGADWRIAQASADSAVAGDDDTIDSPIADNASSDNASSDNASSSESSPRSSIAANRRKKTQATYGIFIGVLALLAVVLIGVLLSVVL